jgi:hypothetical protein
MMIRITKVLGKFLLGNWERIFFGLVGFTCLLFSLKLLYNDQIASGSAIFGIGFLSFLYSNLARFKKFKGLGFEAELWEDKQKEAASLIDQLKGIVSAYTREIVMGNVMRGRWGGGRDRWVDRWSLFEELTRKHTELGQDIDFSQLKHDVDSVFIFDICSPLASSVRQAIDKGKADAQQQLSQKYGSPIIDLEGWNSDSAKLREIESTFDNLFERAKDQNIAQAILDAAAIAQTKLKSSFSLSLEYDAEVMDRLESMAKLIQHRPVSITPQLIEWSNRE